MFLGLRTVIYHAPDLEQAKAWYAAPLSTAGTRRLQPLDHLVREACTRGSPALPKAPPIAPDTSEVTA